MKKLTFRPLKLSLYKYKESLSWQNGSGLVEGPKTNFAGDFLEGIPSESL